MLSPKLASSEMCPDSTKALCDSASVRRSYSFTQLFGKFLYSSVSLSDSRQCVGPACGFLGVFRFPDDFGTVFDKGEGSGAKD